MTNGRYTKAVVELLKERHNIQEDIFPVFDQFIVILDNGDITFDEFVRIINEKFTVEFTKDEMKSIFFDAMVINQDVVDIVKSLKKYRRLLLSNNNPAAVQALRLHHKDILDLFEKTYFSYELKMSKPEKAIFEYALKDSHAVAEECLFIDDKEKNVCAAKEVGMQAIVFENAEKLKKDLEALL